MAISTDLAEQGTPTSAESILFARGVRRSFPVGDRQLEILHGVDLELRRGERLCLMGASGAGKSTLMHILGLLDEPTEGDVVLGGADAWKLSPNERAGLRNREIGFVFQFYHLLPELSAVENVLIPAMIAMSSREYRRARHELVGRAEALLESVELGGRLEHRPAQLSGGEQQRVAIARALFHDPPVIIADEPTGNLDTKTGNKVLELLFREQKKRQLSLLIVTHDERIAKRCERVLYMADGEIQADSKTPIPA